MYIEDNSTNYYAAALEEELKVLRTIEFIKTAVMYKNKIKTKNQSVPWNYYDDLMTLPNIIRNLRYDYIDASFNYGDSKAEPFYVNNTFTGNNGPWPYSALRCSVRQSFPPLGEITADNNGAYGSNIFATKSWEGTYVFSGATMPLDHFNYTNPKREAFSYIFDCSVGYDDYPKKNSNTYLSSYGVIGDNTGILNKHYETDLQIPGLFRAFSVKLSATKIDGTLPPENGLPVYVSMGTYLTAIRIPQFVENIGQYTFFNCQRLASVIIDAPLRAIPTRCFTHCTSLRSINLPDSVISIAKEAFKDCTGLETLHLDGTGMTLIGEGAFENCTSLTTVYFGKSVANIGLSAFAKCENLNRLVFSRQTPPTITTSYGNGTSFFGVKTQGKVIIPTYSSKTAYAAWMSSESGPYSHLQDYSWRVYCVKNGYEVEVWPVDHWNDDESS